MFFFFLDVSNESRDNVQLISATRVVGRKLDALGWTVGEVRAFAITERCTYDGESNLVEYAMTSCEELPGEWPTALDRYEWYTRLPAGNCLSEEELQSVCDQLNDFFARLRDGTYTGQWVDDPVQAALSVWDAARPVPVAVTPEVLRSDEQVEYNPQCTRTLAQDGSLDLILNFSFALAAPINR